MGVLLLASLLLPLAGAMLVLVDPRHARHTALAATVLGFVLAAVIIGHYPAVVAEFSIPQADTWPGGGPLAVDIRFSMGLDGLSLWLFGLTTLLMIVAVLVSWEAIHQQTCAYYSLLLVLETGMLGVFAARDIILFYVFFEFTLIPLFLLIGIWGSQQRRYAAIKFFLFTLAGSVLTFLGLLAIVLWDYCQTGRMTFSIPRLTADLAAHPMDSLLQLGIFLALFAGFAIKVPLFPLHTWLPLAHVEAPAAGSVILAGVLLKVGTYGFLRFSLPMLPQATALCMPWLLWLSVAGIIYGALVALAQADIKRLIAYSSVSHLGFCMLGIFALNRLGMQGGLLQMVNHGLSTGGLFALVGMLYERYHTRQIRDFGGLARKTPLLAFFLLLLALSSIGLPGLNGFAGEFLLLLGMFQRAWADRPAGLPEAWVGHLRAISVLAVSGVVLGAWYMLWLVKRVLFGPQREPQTEDAHSKRPVRDLSAREVLALAPLAVFIFWIGLQPAFFLDRMNPAASQLADQAARSLATSAPGQAKGLAQGLAPSGQTAAPGWQPRQVRSPGLAARQTVVASEEN